MAMMYAKGKLRIGDINDPDAPEFEITEVTVNFERNPRAKPGERWCRYCGGGIGQAELWRMSCDDCWETESPSSFQVAQLYGAFSLGHSPTAQRVLSIISTTA
jgi:hypothetical protein